MKAVNDAPIVSQPLEDIELLEDSGVATVVLSNVFTDVDGDSLVYDVTIDTDGIISAEINGDTLIISTISNQYGGPVGVIVTANDQQNGAVASDYFTVTVTPSNDPPNISGIDDQEINEDGLFLYSIQADDVDGDLLEFTIEEDSSLADISISSNLLSVTPIANFNGDIIVTVTVSDGEFTDSTDFTLR